MKNLGIFEGQKYAGQLVSLYSTHISTVAQKLGIHDWLSDQFWRLKPARYSWTKRHEIDSVSCRFEISTRSEYNRFNSLMDERPIIRDLMDNITSDDVVYDIGANVGMYSCFIASKVPPEQLVAFEPHPNNVEKLRSNLDMNNQTARVFELALSDENTIAELTVESGEAGEGTHSIAVDEGQETIEIELVRGDDLINDSKIAKPSIIKIDVEGSELQVLQGMKSTIADTNCRICYVEVHSDRLPNYEGTKQELESLLQSTGFELSVLQERGSEYFIKAVKE